jgi:hypothetical protein
MSETNDGFTVQDMLFLIGVQTRTGELVVESGNNIGSIVFHQGTVLQAYSPYSRAIGDLMVEDGVITEAELFEALEQQKKKMSIPIGTLLLQTGKVSFTLIEKLVHDQIRNAIRDFSAWENVHFSFVAKEVAPFDNIQLQVQDLLLPDTIKAFQQFLERKHGASIQPSIPTVHSSGFPTRK